MVGYLYIELNLYIELKWTELYNFFMDFVSPFSLVHSYVSNISYQVIVVFNLRVNALNRKKRCVTLHLITNDFILNNLDTYKQMLVQAL